jgi:hypothetical protein
VHKRERQNIISAINARPFRLPIPDDVADKAVDDEDGDALDALVLIVGRWIARGLSADEWNCQLDGIDCRGATVEGWFPV